MAAPVEQLRACIRLVDQLIAANERMRAELEEIARISEPGKAWPHERVRRVLAGGEGGG